MGITSDPNDPRLSHGTDSGPTPQADVYLVLSEEERAKGFVRPLRRSYRHVGPGGPTHPLVMLPNEETECPSGFGYVAYEPYPPDSDVIGRYWTQAQLDAAASGGCGTVTTMGLELCETYARDPNFYGATFCVRCSMHRPVAEFRWVEDGEIVGS